MSIELVMTRELWINLIVVWGASLIVAFIWGMAFDAYLWKKKLSQPVEDSVMGNYRRAKAAEEVE